MDRDEFRERLSDVGMDVQSFAQFSGWSPNTVREWGSGAPVPRPARAMVDLLGKVRRTPGQRREGQS